MYHRTEYGSIEVFTLTAEDFFDTYLKDEKAVRQGARESGDWRTEAMREALGRDPHQVLAHDALDTAEALAGVYWWACFPGCLPDSDAFGPFASEDEALADFLGE